MSITATASSPLSTSPDAGKKKLALLDAELKAELRDGQVGSAQAKALLEDVGPDAAHAPADLLAKVEASYLQNIDAFAPAAQKVMQDFLFPGGALPSLAEPTYVTNANDAAWAADAHYTTLFGKLFVDGVRGSDVEQGMVGDCSLLSSIAALGHAKRDAIRQLFTENPDGTVGVHLFKMQPDGSSKPVTVTVDRNVAVHERTDWHGSHLVDARSRVPNELWPALLEKAAASVTQIDTLYPWDALSMLTGTRSSAIDTQKLDEAQIYDQLRFELGRHQPVVAFTWCDDKHDALFAKTGVALDGHFPTNIVSGHAYAVLGAREVNGEKMVTLRNPWGQHTPDSTAADAQGGLTGKAADHVGAVGAHTNGIFELPLSQFRELYPYMTYPDPRVVGLATDAPAGEVPDDLRDKV